VPRFVGPDHTSIKGSLLNANDADHARIRSVVIPAFTLSRFAQMREEMETVCRRLAVRMKGAGPVDLISAYCNPVSRWFTRMFLDISEAQQVKIEPVVREQTDLAASPAAVESATAEMTNLAAHIATVATPTGRSNPIARLRTAEREREVAAEEVIGTTALLLMVATDALLPLLGVGMMRMLLDQRLRGSCVEKPSLWPKVASEVFRYSNNALVEFPRVAMTDIDVNGAHIEAGEAVVTSTLAAGWDPAAVEHPARFGLDRCSDESLPFGAGRRACPARGIAHGALTVALEAMFTEIPDARLISDPGGSIPVDSICPSHIWISA
jgi:cytochrome P450